jgi:hypothetical protein
MKLSDLTAQFQGLMNRGDMRNNAALATTFINQAILRLQRELRVPFMEKTILYTIPSDGSWNGKISIPADLLELIDIMVDSDSDGVCDYPLQKAGLKETMTLSEPGYAGPFPRVYSRKGGSWILGPAPALGAFVEISYFAEFAPLVNPTDENTCSKVAWDAIIYGALSAAADYYIDDRAQAFEARYKQITAMLQEQADADELTADAAVRPAWVFNDDLNDGY